MGKEYENVMCQNCGGFGDAHEVIEGDCPVDHQEWMYCKACDIETFKDMPNETK